MAVVRSDPTGNRLASQRFDLIHALPAWIAVTAIADKQAAAYPERCRQGSMTSGLNQSGSTGSVTKPIFVRPDLAASDITCTTLR